MSVCPLPRKSKAIDKREGAGRETERLRIQQQQQHPSSSSSINRHHQMDLITSTMPSRPTPPERRLTIRMSKTTKAELVSLQKGAKITLEEEDFVIETNDPLLSVLTLQSAEGIILRKKYEAVAKPGFFIERAVVVSETNPVLADSDAPLNEATNKVITTKAKGAKAKDIIKKGAKVAKITVLKKKASVITVCHATESTTTINNNDKDTTDNNELEDKDNENSDNDNSDTDTMENYSDNSNKDTAEINADFEDIPDNEMTEGPDSPIIPVITSQLELIKVAVKEVVGEIIDEKLNSFYQKMLEFSKNRPELNHKCTQTYSSGTPILNDNCINSTPTNNKPYNSDNDILCSTVPSSKSITPCTHSIAKTTDTTPLTDLANKSDTTDQVDLPTLHIRDVFDYGDDSTDATDHPDLPPLTFSLVESVINPDHDNKHERTSTPKSVAGVVKRKILHTTPTNSKQIRSDYINSSITNINNHDSDSDNDLNEDIFPYTLPFSLTTTPCSITTRPVIADITDVCSTVPSSKSITPCTHSIAKTTDTTPLTDLANRLTDQVDLPTLHIRDVFDYGDDNTDATDHTALPSRTNIFIDHHNKHDPRYQKLFKRMKTRTQFACNVIREFFSDQEMIGKNCRGINRPALEKESLTKAKDIVMYYFPVEAHETEQKAWRACESMIDGRIRKLKLDK